MSRLPATRFAYRRGVAVALASCSVRWAGINHVPVARFCIVAGRYVETTYPARDSAPRNMAFCSKSLSHGGVPFPTLSSRLRIGYPGEGGMQRTTHIAMP